MANTLLQIVLKNDDKFVIEKDLLISKSAYFAALLSGAWGSTFTDTVTLDNGNDTTVFAQLLLYIRTGKNSESFIRSATNIEKLTEMASYYLVEFEPPVIEKITTHFYRCESPVILNEDDIAEMNTICESTVFLTGLKSRDAVHRILLKIWLLKCCSNIFFTDGSDAHYTKRDLRDVNLVTVNSIEEMERLCPGFKNEFTEY